MTTSPEFRDRMHGIRLIPIYTPIDLTHTRALCDALIQSGISAIELTLRDDRAWPVLEQLTADGLPLKIGAGTILNLAHLHRAAVCKPDFMVSPGLSRRMLRSAREQDICLLPGVATASEVMRGLDAGYRDFKLFPAEAVGGQALLKSWAGPLAEARFCPTGGVHQGNVQQYLALDNVLCVGGSWMIDGDAVARGDLDSVVGSLKQAAALLD